MIEPAAAARVFAQYGKKYQAGLYGSPIGKELAEAQRHGCLHEHDGTLVLQILPKLKHSFTDFTGRRINVPGDVAVARYIATPDNGPIPSLRQYYFAYAYMEDKRLVSALKAQGFNLAAVKITAASEIIGFWWQGAAQTYRNWDLATMTEIPIDIPGQLRNAIKAEIKAISGWRDDDPYYHKGEWSHVSLRGYKPDDPHWGVKPSEMSRNWWTEHPEAKAFKKPDWTVLAPKCPALMKLINSVKWWHAFDRIRLLRLTTGQLKRHTDITDREAGTRDGQISRFHLPIQSHETVTTTGWDLQGDPATAHWHEWRLYYLDQRKPHAVANPSEQERIHLVVDVVTDESVRLAVGRAHAGKLF